MKPPVLHVTAVDDAGFDVHLEPEGMSYAVRPGQSIKLTLPVASGPVEISWHPRGLIVGRDVDCHELPEVRADDGARLDW